MKRFSFLPLFFTLVVGLLSGCKQLDTISYSPPLSPSAFLASQPWIRIHLGALEFIWTQPTSTVIVYLAGLLAIYAGYWFLVGFKHQQSKFWWGIGLILTGIGALFAGTSYQALGYEIKCNGREFCTWTSWWEVLYMLFSAPGMNAFLVASAYSNLNGKVRKAVLLYAAISTVAYIALLLYGAFVPIQWLVTFEFLVAVSMPVGLFLLGLHGYAYAKEHKSMDLYIRNSWLLFFCVGLAYGGYLVSGIGISLWQKGIWFSENDVLHTGLICWLLYILKRLPDSVKDVSKLN